MNAPHGGRIAPPAPTPSWLVVLLTAIVTAAVTAGLCVGTPAPAAPSVAPAPAYFCPAGQHLAAVRAGLPECAR